VAGVISAIRAVLSKYDTQTPIVIFSSMAPVIAADPGSARKNIEDITAHFQQLSNTRDVLMPSFTNGYQDGAINLDLAPSRNGILAESFRERNPKNRTLSAYFSFIAVGPSQNLLFSLEPKHVWGDGSLYEWMEKTDSTILTIGLPPYVCSFQHRAEYLERDKISYREFIQRSGFITIRGARKLTTETLFASKMGSVGDFRPMGAFMHLAGVETKSSSGITVSAVSAKRKLELARSLIRSNNSIFQVRKVHQ
jgi:aminoglycoside N3'-acetyltransferase